MALSESDQVFLREAVSLASAAVARGDHPFGCTIVRRLKKRDDGDSASPPALPDAEIVVRAMNSVNTRRDPTGHAETNAIRAFGEYAAALPSDIKSKYQYELFTSTEPCVMCCGAIYWSFSISRVVYACAETTLANHAGDDFLCPCRETFARGRNQVITVEGPFLEEEAEALHAAYWPTVLNEH